MKKLVACVEAHKLIVPVRHQQISGISWKNISILIQWDNNEFE
jgi:predicted aconitase